MENKIESHEMMVHFSVHMHAIKLSFTKDMHNYISFSALAHMTWEQGK